MEQKMIDLSLLITYTSKLVNKEIDKVTTFFFF